MTLISISSMRLIPASLAAIAILSVQSARAQAPAQTQAAEAPSSAASEASATPEAPAPAPAAKAATSKAKPLSPDALPATDDATVPGVYKDMVVVQRKAKVKAKSFLVSAYGTLDFSDGPITNYALNTDVGYAISDSWEVYLNFVPYFVTIERPIVGKVRALTLANGQQATITYAKPTYQYGAELLWLPAYGKESWGPKSIVRSDTFFKIGLGQTAFQSGDTGLRFAGMVGKTYFVRTALNIRVDAGVSYAQTVVDGTKTGTWAPVLEAGLVFYF